MNRKSLGLRSAGLVNLSLRGSSPLIKLVCCVQRNVSHLVDCPTLTNKQRHHLTTKDSLVCREGTYTELLSEFLFEGFVFSADILSDELINRVLVNDLFLAILLHIQLQ